jgi:hypothetical protein
MQVRYGVGYSNWRDLVVPRQRQKEHYELAFTDSKSRPVLLEIESSHHAESILRGLVHSGFAVTIREVKTMVDVPVDDYTIKSVDYGRLEPTGCQPMTDCDTPERPHF